MCTRLARVACVELREGAALTNHRPRCCEGSHFVKKELPMHGIMWDGFP